MASEEPSLTIQIGQREDHLEVVLGGVAETDTVDGLGDSLERVHAQAQTTASHRVVIDLVGLEFATSSALKEFVTWLQRARDLAPPSRYQIEFHTTKRHHWQVRSIRALQAFAGDVMSVRDEP